MAFVTILSQPETASINSTLTSIPFRLQESTPDTINVIATVYYYNPTTLWQQWGGVMRSAPNLDYPDNYYLNIADLVNSLPQGPTSKLSGLDQGLCMGVNPFGGVPQSYWANISDWKVRVDFQREYLDGTTGLIEVDPDIETSKEFYVHQGAPPLSEIINGTVATTNDMQFNPWLHIQDATNEKGNWLFMTDNPLKLRNRASNYEFETYSDESLFLSCWNDVKSPLTLQNEMQIVTYKSTTASLNQHIVPWSAFGGFSKAGYMSMNVGGKVFTGGGLTPNAAEGNTAGLEFENVNFYEVRNMVSNTAGTALASYSVKAKVIWNRNCKPEGYARFLWQNQLGAWDMFTSNGMVTTKSKIKRHQFEKRIDMFSAGGNYEEYGKSNWVNMLTKRHKVTTHDLENHEVDFITKMLGSPSVHLRVDMDAFKGLNMRTFFSFDLREGWFDDQNCMRFVPIIIKTNIINMRKTSEHATKVSFEYEFALEELFPRM